MAIDPKFPVTGQFNLGAVAGGTSRVGSGPGTTMQGSAGPDLATALSGTASGAQGLVEMIGAATGAANNFAAVVEGIGAKDIFKGIRASAASVLKELEALTNYAQNHLTKAFAGPGTELSKLKDQIVALGGHVDKSALATPVVSAHPPAQAVAATASAATATLRHMAGQPIGSNPIAQGAFMVTNHNSGSSMGPKAFQDQMRAESWKWNSAAKGGKGFWSMPEDAFKQQYPQQPPSTPSTSGFPSTTPSGGRYNPSGVVNVGPYATPIAPVGALPQVEAQPTSTHAVSGTNLTPKNFVKGAQPREKVIDTVAVTASKNQREFDAVHFDVKTAAFSEKIITEAAMDKIRVAGKTANEFYQKILDGTAGATKITPDRAQAAIQKNEMRILQAEKLKEMSDNGYGGKDVQGMGAAFMGAGLAVGGIFAGMQLVKGAIHESIRAAEEFDRAMGRVRANLAGLPGGGVANNLEEGIKKGALANARRLGTDVFKAVETESSVHMAFQNDPENERLRLGKTVQNLDYMGHVQGKELLSMLAPMKNAGMGAGEAQKTLEVMAMVSAQFGMTKERFRALAVATMAQAPALEHFGGMDTSLALGAQEAAGSKDVVLGSRLNRIQASLQNGRTLERLREILTRNATRSSINGVPIEEIINNGNPMSTLGMLAEMGQKGAINKGEIRQVAQTIDRWNAPGTINLLSGGLQKWKEDVGVKRALAEGGLSVTDRQAAIMTDSFTDSAHRLKQAFDQMIGEGVKPVTRIMANLAEFLGEFLSDLSPLTKKLLSGILTTATYAGTSLLMTSMVGGAYGTFSGQNIAKSAGSAVKGALSGVGQLFGGKTAEQMAVIAETNAARELMIADAKALLIKEAAAHTAEVAVAGTGMLAPAAVGAGEAAVIAPTAAGVVSATVIGAVVLAIVAMLGAGVSYYYSQHQEEAKKVAAENEAKQSQAVQEAAPEVLERKVAGTEFRDAVTEYNNALAETHPHNERIIAAKNKILELGKSDVKAAKEKNEELKITDDWLAKEQERKDALDRPRREKAAAQTALLDFAGNHVYEGEFKSSESAYVPDPQIGSVTVRNSFKVDRTKIDAALAKMAPLQEMQNAMTDAVNTYIDKAGMTEVPLEQLRERINLKFEELFGPIKSRAVAEQTLIGFPALFKEGKLDAPKIKEQATIGASAESKDRINDIITKMGNRKRAGEVISQDDIAAAQMDINAEKPSAEILKAAAHRLLVTLGYQGKSMIKIEQDLATSYNELNKDVTVFKEVGDKDKIPGSGNMEGTKLTQKQIYDFSVRAKTEKIDPDKPLFGETNKNTREFQGFYKTITDAYTLGTPTSPSVKLIDTGKAAKTEALRVLKTGATVDGSLSATMQKTPTDFLQPMLGRVRLLEQAGRAGDFTGFQPTFANYINPDHIDAEYKKSLDQLKVHTAYTADKIKMAQEVERLKSQRDSLMLMTTNQFKRKLITEGVSFIEKEGYELTPDRADSRTQGIAARGQFERAEAARDKVFGIRSYTDIPEPDQPMMLKLEAFQKSKEDLAEIPAILASARYSMTHTFVEKKYKDGRPMLDADNKAIGDWEEHEAPKGFEAILTGHEADLRRRADTERQTAERAIQKELLQRRIGGIELDSQTKISLGTLGADSFGNERDQHQAQRDVIDYQIDAQRQILSAYHGNAAEIEKSIAAQQKITDLTKQRLLIDEDLLAYKKMQAAGKQFSDSVVTNLLTGDSKTRMKTETWTGFLTTAVRGGQIEQVNHMLNSDKMKDIFGGNPLGKLGEKLFDPTGESRKEAAMVKQTTAQEELTKATRELTAALAAITARQNAEVDANKSVLGTAPDLDPHEKNVKHLSPEGKAKADAIKPTSEAPIPELAPKLPPAETDRKPSFVDQVAEQKLRNSTSPEDVEAVKKVDAVIAHDKAALRKRNESDANQLREYNLEQAHIRQENISYYIRPEQGIEAATAEEQYILEQRAVQEAKTPTPGYYSGYAFPAGFNFAEFQSNYALGADGMPQVGVGGTVSAAVPNISSDQYLVDDWIGEGTHVSASKLPKPFGITDSTHPAVAKYLEKTKRAERAGGTFGAGWKAPQNVFEKGFWDVTRDGEGLNEVVGTGKGMKVLTDEAGNTLRNADGSAQVGASAEGFGSGAAAAGGIGIAAYQGWMQERGNGSSAQTKSAVGSGLMSAGGMVAMTGAGAPAGLAMMAVGLAFQIAAGNAAAEYQKKLQEEALQKQEQERARMIAIMEDQRKMLGMAAERILAAKAEVGNPYAGTAASAFLSGRYAQSATIQVSNLTVMANSPQELSRALTDAVYTQVRRGA